MSEAPKSLILSSLADRVMTIRMNRLDKKNALTQAMYVELNEAFIAAGNNAEVRAVVITGGIEAFSSGNDLQDFLQVSSVPEDLPVFRLMKTLAGFAKPVVAAVNGPAIGIGVTLLLHCDLVYAGSSTRLQLPFVNIGICAEFASSLLLPRIMGHARASELLLLGEPFTAKTALEYGLINAVLPEAEVEPHALQRAKKLAQQPPNALRVTKRLMKRWTEKEVLEAIPLEGSLFVPMLKQPEALEAINAFMTKRKPDFSKFE